MGVIAAINRVHQGIAVGPDLHHQGLAFARLFGQAVRFSTWTVTLVSQPPGLQPYPTC